jgi:hypothetical protein
MDNISSVPSNIKWNDAVERLIKGIGEKALSMSWLHNKSEKRYKYLNNYLAIPSIILSSVTGAGSIGFGSEGNISYIMGGLSLLVSILSTLNSYFVFAQRSTEHKIAAVQYSKLYLTISIELALPRLKRMNVKDFLKVISQECQRLNEIQPQIPDIVIKEYKKAFKDEPETISRPEITNGLVSIGIYNETESPPTIVERPAITIDTGIQTILDNPEIVIISNDDLKKDKKPSWK